MHLVIVGRNMLIRNDPHVTLHPASSPGHRKGSCSMFCKSHCFLRFEKHLTIVGLYTAHPPKIPYKIKSLLNVVIFRNSPLLMTCNNKLYYSVWCGGSIVSGSVQGCGVLHVCEWLYPDIDRVFSCTNLPRPPLSTERFKETE